MSFRRGSPSELERSTHAVAIEAIEEGRFDDAAALAAYVIEEGTEPQEVYVAWVEAIPEFLIRNGVPREAVEAEIARITALLSPDEDNPLDFEPGWDRYKELIAEAVACCEKKDKPGAIAAIEAAALHWREDHDRKCDWVCELLGFLAKTLGQERVVEFWDEGMAIWYGNYSRFAPDNQDWSLSHRQLVDMAIFALRGHMPGPKRGGDITYRDEGDCIAVEFAPCGSGGRTFDTAPDGTPPRFEPPYGHALVEGKHDWAWNLEGVCLYCTHCCRLGQQKAIEAMGYPARVVSPPVWPRDREKSVCTWRFYKHPDLIPDEAFLEVGATPPARRGEGGNKP